MSIGLFLIDAMQFASWPEKSEAHLRNAFKAIHRDGCKGADARHKAGHVSFEIIHSAARR